MLFQMPPSLGGGGPPFTNPRWTLHSKGNIQSCAVHRVVLTLHKVKANVKRIAAQASHPDVHLLGFPAMLHRDLHKRRLRLAAAAPVARAAASTVGLDGRHVRRQRLAPGRTAEEVLQAAQVALHAAVVEPDESCTKGCYPLLWKFTKKGALCPRLVCVVRNVRIACAERWLT